MKRLMWCLVLAGVEWGTLVPKQLDTDADHAETSSVPRQARLDAPDTLHHVMWRGIERTAIFRDDTDRAEFLPSSIRAG
jgi:hypothetical protein